MFPKSYFFNLNNSPEAPGLYMHPQQTVLDYRHFPFRQPSWKLKQGRFDEITYRQLSLPPTQENHRISSFSLSETIFQAKSFFISSSSSSLSQVYIIANEPAERRREAGEAAAL